MKLKNVIIGDIVKVVPDDAYKKVCDFLKRDYNSKNLFEVRYIEYNDKDPQDTWYVLVEIGKNMEDTQCISLKKKRLEVVSPVGVCINIDMSFSEMLSFNKVGKDILSKIESCNIRNLERNHYSVIVEDGEYMVTCIPFDKIRLFKNDYYNEQLRSKYCQKIKPIKIIQELLGETLPQEKIDGLLACINKEIDADFEIVRGKDITKYYNEAYYASEAGTLGRSCMRYGKLGLKGTFYIYEDYAEMIILKDRKSDVIYGRAILWTLHGDKEIEGKKFMDRIYTTNDSFVGIFKKFAIDNGFYYLKKQTYSQNIMMFGNEEINMNYLSDIYVNIGTRINQYMFYPYIDTFQYELSDKSGRLYPNIDFSNSNTVLCSYNYTGGCRCITSIGRKAGYRSGSDD